MTSILADLYRHYHVQRHDQSQTVHRVCEWFKFACLHNKYNKSQSSLKAKGHIHILPIMLLYPFVLCEWHMQLECQDFPQLPYFSTIIVSFGKLFEDSIRTHSFHSISKKLLLYLQSAQCTRPHAPETKAQIMS